MAPSFTKPPPTPVMFPANAALPLAEDPAGLLDLPPGFSYSIVSSAGEVMDDGYFAPESFDGMACFPLDGSRVAGRSGGPIYELFRLPYWSI